MCKYPLEDEEHFVFNCANYEEVRKRNSLFETTEAKRKDLFQLLKSEDEKIILSLAKYIAEANSIRIQNVK